MELLWIKGYEDKYSCDKEGKVYSHYKNGDIKEIGSQSKRGYIQVNLSKDGTKTYKLVHRLIAEAFIPNPENLPVVDHIDEDKTNNRVENLRWCTQEKNTEYYNTKDGRDYHQRLHREQKEKIKALMLQVSLEKREVLKLRKEVERLQKQLIVDQEKFEKHRKQEAKKLVVTKHSYTGYKDVTGTKFGNVADMVEATGKQIKVQGRLFPSCGSAAMWIVEQEANLGNIRNKDTISKELRRYLQGRRSEWEMYGKYKIGD